MGPVLAALDRASAFTKRVARERYALAATLIVMYIVVYNGVGLVPTRGYQIQASNPFVTRSELGPDRYSQSDLLLPLLAYALHATSTASFTGLCAAVLCATLAGLAWYLRGAFDADTGLLLFALVASHPVMTVMLSWLGTPDVFTFAASAITFGSSAPLVLAATGFLAAANHPIATFSLPMLVLLRRIAGDGIRVAQMAALAAGLAAGTLAVRAFVAHQEIVMTSRLTYVLRAGPGQWARHSLATAPLAIWSVHGGVWATLAVCAIWLWNSERRYVLAFAAIMAASYAVVFFTIDTTRTFSLLTWAAALHVVSTAARRARASNTIAAMNRWLAGLSLLALTSPRLYVWGEGVFAPPFGNPIRWLAHLL